MSLAGAFYPLTVADVRRDTREALVVTLAAPEEHRDKFRFRAGQYLTFRTHIDDAEVRRSYSICAAQGEECRVGIKLVADGAFTTWAHGALLPGAVIDAMAPAGNFGANLADGGRSFLGVAAGSGITPLLGIIKTVLASGRTSRFALIYGNRASSTIMFREELENLKNEYLGRFSVTHILSREQQDVELFNGRIDRDKCDQLFRSWIDVGSVELAFICGPEDMMRAVAASLEAHGVDKTRIKMELFGTAPGPKRASAERVHAGAGCRATVTLHGRSVQFWIERGTISILDAALRQGLDAPFACKAGVCSTCRAMLVEGQADMDANYALEDYEIARGYILTCQAYPVSDVIGVDYDR